MSGAAEAGPSSGRSLNGNAASVVSYRQIYQYLEDASAAVPPDDLERLLNARLNRFHLCGSPLPKASGDSVLNTNARIVQLETGERVEISEELRDLTRTVSERHDLEELQTVGFLRSYLDSESHSLDALVASQGGPQAPKRLLTGRKGGVAGDFLDLFNVFLFEEELSICRCTAALLRIAEDDTHAYYQIAQKLLPEIITEGFAEECIERLKTRTSHTLPSHVRDSPRLSAFWARHNLLLQLAILEVLFLTYYGFRQPSGRFVVAFLQFLDDTDMGQRQVNAPFFDTQSLAVLECIQQIMALIAAESLDLERAMDDAPAKAHRHSYQRQDVSVTLTTNEVDVALDVLERLVADSTKAPIFLAWAFTLKTLEESLSDNAVTGQKVDDTSLLRLLSPSDGGDSVWKRLATAAFAPRLELFAALAAIGRSPLLSPNCISTLEISSGSSLALRSVLKGLVLSITEVVRPEYISDFYGLIDTWTATFDARDTSQDIQIGVAALCVQFWQSDSQYESRRTVLDLAKQRWPVSFSPLLRLLRALAACDATSTAHSQGSTVAAAAAFQELRYISSLASVLPPTSGAARPPWEVIESPDYSSIDYRTTRPLPLFGSRIVVPAGTTGRMVSEDSAKPAIVIWDLSDQPLNGWWILQDVLAYFADTLDPSHTAATSSDDVFQDKVPKTANFDHFAPEAPSSSVVTTEIIDVFSAVLSGMGDHAPLFIDHLESCPKPVNLVLILRRILTQALRADEQPAELIGSGYRLMSILLFLRPSDVWLALRSSDIIVGADTQGSWTLQSRPSATSSSLLRTQIASGSFGALRSLLHFHVSLWSELTRSLCVVSTSLLRVKIDVQSRAIAWMSEVVWPQHQSWRFNREDERTEISSMCLHILESIMIDPVAPAELSSIPRRFLLTEGRLPSLSPLIHILIYSGQHLESSYREGKYEEASRLHDLLSNCLCFSRVLVDLNSEARAAGTMPADQVGALEALLLGRAPAPLRAFSRRNDPDALIATSTTVLEAIAGHLFSALSMPLSRNAALLLASICQAAHSSIQEGHFLDHFRDQPLVIPKLVSIVDDPQQDTELREAVWTLATALLSGRSANTKSPFSRQGDMPHIRMLASSSAMQHCKHLLQVAVDTVSLHQALWQHDPRLLHGIMRFLCCVWGSAMASEQHLANVRRNSKFWSAITNIITMENVEYNDADMSEGQVAATSYQIATKARALALLRLEFESSSTQDEASEAGRAFASMLSSVAFGASVEQAFEMQADPHLESNLLATWTTAFPQLPLLAFRHSAKRHDFDDRQFGIKYLYDSQALSTHLSSSQEHLAQPDDGSIIVDQSAIERALEMVNNVSLEWSKIDAQTALLRSWCALFSSLPPTPTSITMESLQRLRDKSAQIWISAAKCTAGEQRSGPVMLAFHTERLALLEVVLERVWSIRADTSTDGGYEQLCEVMKLVNQLLSHPDFAPLDSIKGLHATSFHGSLLKIALLCARRINQVVQNKHESKNMQHTRAEQHKDLHHLAGSISLFSVTCLRTVLDKAIHASISGDSAMLPPIEKELALSASILEHLLASDARLEPHSWAHALREAGILNAVVGLFRHTRLFAPSDALVETIDAPRFMMALLSLCLKLSSFPQLAEHLILAGIMSALCSNALTPNLEGGTLRTESKAHVCWTLILQLVVALINGVDDDHDITWASASGRFVDTEVSGFIRLYGAQFARGIKFAPLRQAMPSSVSAGKGLLALNHLQELRATLRLFFAMASANNTGTQCSSTVTNRYTQEVLSMFAERTAASLQQMVYLLQRPHHLATLLNASIDSERDQTLLTELMNEIASTAIGALLHFCRAEAALAFNGPVISAVTPPLLTNEIQTAPNEATSIGTLIDLASFLLELQQNDKVDEDQRHRLRAYLEQCLTFAVSQFALHLRQKSREVRSGVRDAVEPARDVHRDLLSILRSVRSLMAQRDTAAEDVFTQLIRICERLSDI
ncbi:unnamed protein product [Jaminaea pallidilutea]